MSEIQSNSTKPPFKFNKGQKFSLGCAGIAIAIPLVLVGYLFFLTTFGPGCAECSAGWSAVFAVWLAIPVLIGAVIVFIVSSMMRLVKTSSSGSRKVANRSKAKKGKINFG